MMRFIKFLLGLTIGAAAGVLLAPKSGRELREQMFGGAAAKLLPPDAEHYPLPEGRHTGHEDAATPEQPPMATPYAETAVATESIVEQPPAAADETARQDLLARIRATRVAVEAEFAEPFGPAPTAEAAPMAEPAPIPEPILYWELTPEAVAAQEPAPGGRELEDLWADEADPAAAAQPWQAPSEAVAEPVAEAVAEAVVEPVAEAVAEAVAEPVVEAVAEAVAEPVAEAVVEPVAEAVAEAVAEPVMEPVAEVVMEPVAEVVAEAAPERKRAPVPVPATETGGGGAVDQAEMRRRIEETRARLKAKAFDAMMSGESALLRNDSGTRTVPAGDEASLAPEVDSTIDESLSPEDP